MEKTIITEEECTWSIYENGLPLDKPKFVERFKGGVRDLKERLIELQRGHCEKEKPNFIGNENLALECYSSSDYSHVAYLTSKG